VILGPAGAAAEHSGLRNAHDYETLLAAGEPDTFDWPELDERGACALCYTSGTTGNPKGVLYRPPRARTAYLRLPDARRDGRSPRATS
jgi:fatty-acyl-CoA synthase